MPEQVAEQNESKERKLAATQSDLAHALGFKDRKTIQRIIKKCPEAPRATANGSHDVEAWRTFLTDSGKILEKLIEVDPAGESIADKEKRKLDIGNERSAFKLAQDKKIFIPRSVVKSVGTKLLNAAKTRSLSGGPRFVTLIRMAKDMTEASEIYRKEMLDLWSEMERCEWFQP